MLHTKHTWKRLCAILMIVTIALLSAACSSASDEEGPMTSKVDDVSDDVYEQLLEHYFYLTTFTDMLLGNVDNEEENTLDFYEDHILYEKALEYVESEDENIRPMNVFPNPLLYEYLENPDDYTETETKYIDQMLDYMEASNRANREDYTTLKADLKEELQIDEEDNMFP